MAAAVSVVRHLRSIPVWLTRTVTPRDHEQPWQPVSLHLRSFENTGCPRFPHVTSFVVANPKTPRHRAKTTLSNQQTCAHGMSFDQKLSESKQTRQVYSSGVGPQKRVVPGTHLVGVSKWPPFVVPVLCWFTFCSTCAISAPSHSSTLAPSIKKRNVGHERISKESLTSWMLWSYTCGGKKNTGERTRKSGCIPHAAFLLPVCAFQCNRSSTDARCGICMENKGLPSQTRHQEFSSQAPHNGG